jgi:WD40 repeat protein
MLFLNRVHRLALFSSLSVYGNFLTYFAQCAEPTILYKAHGDGNKAVLSKVEKDTPKITFVKEFDARKKVVHVDATQDGKYVLACTDNRITVWSVASGNKLFFKDGKNPSIRFNPRKDMSLLGDIDGKDFKSGFTGDPPHYIVKTSDGFEVFEKTKAEKPKWLFVPPGKPQYCDQSSDGVYVLATTDQGLWIWKTSDGTLVLHRKGKLRLAMFDTDNPEEILIHIDGEIETLVLGKRKEPERLNFAHDNDKNVEVYYKQEKKPRFSVTPMGKIRWAHVSTNNKYVLTVTDEGVFVWSIAQKGKELFRVLGKNVTAVFDVDDKESRTLLGGIGDMLETWIFSDKEETKGR